MIYDKECVSIEGGDQLVWKYFFYNYYVILKG